MRHKMLDLRWESLKSNFFAAPSLPSEAPREGGPGYPLLLLAPRSNPLRCGVSASIPVRPIGGPVRPIGGPVRTIGGPGRFIASTSGPVRSSTQSITTLKLLLAACSLQHAACGITTNAIKKNLLTACSLWLVACSLFSCQNKRSEQNSSTQSITKYAVGFRVTEVGNSKLIDVNPYQNATSNYQYLLVPKGANVPSHNESTTVIFVPIETIVCTSTTHIPLLDYIGETNRLIGFPTTDYISSEKMRKRIDAGLVKELGIDKGMNIEALYTLKPSVVMGYTMGNELGQLKKIQELKIPVVINAEYLEKHPLGRAEWIKFMALFFGKEKEADSVFNEIEKEYLVTVALAKQAVTKSTVLSGILYGDAWFMPGGRNYAARLLEDAGCAYLWAADTTNGFLQLGFESVYTKAKEADRWIGVGSFKSLDEIKASESRYALFKPFREKQVYTYNARTGAKGGSEFLELGYLRPDLILKDLVKIAHPELMTEYEFYFHRRLE